MSKENFGLSNAQYNTILPACLIAVGVLMVASIDIYLPAAPFLRQHFATSEWMIQLSMMQTPIVASFIGLLYGYWSDTKGRRSAMLSSLGIFALGSFLCCLAWNIESFLVCRFFQAIGGGGISVISLSVLSDMFKGPIYARYMATYSMGYPIMFALAPVIGANLFTHFGWQANFWFLGLVSSILWGILYKIMPETLEKKATQNVLDWREIFQGLKILTKTDRFMIFAICHGLPVAIAAVYSANSAFVFIDDFKFSPTSYAYIQLIPVLVNLAGSILYREKVVAWGIGKSLKFGLMLNLLFLSLTLLGIFFEKLQLPFSVILIICIFNLSLSSVIASCNTRAIELSADKKGLAVAYLGLIRNGVVAGLVLLVGLFFNGTIVPVYLGMAILTAILVALIWPHAR